MSMIKYIAENYEGDEGTFFVKDGIYLISS